MRGSRTRVATVTIGLGVLAALTGETPCFAQMIGDGGPTGLGAQTQRNLSAARAGAGKGQVAPPPVLPGTKTAPQAVAPASLPADASPTDALFDAINRGDIAAARDAVNRGASLDDHNILGQSPLELSIDLGRNDITFLLLSMREGDSTSRQVARRGTNATEQAMPVAEAARPVRRPARTFARAAAEAEEPAVVAPRLYSSDGGAAIPAAGFVGFGRSSR